MSALDYGARMTFEHNGQTFFAGWVSCYRGFTDYAYRARGASTDTRVRGERRADWSPFDRLCVAHVKRQQRRELRAMCERQRIDWKTAMRALKLDCDNCGAKRAVRDRSPFAECRECGMPRTPIDTLECVDFADDGSAA